MEARVFYMAQDEPLLPEIRTFLQTYISPSLRIREDLFDPTSRESSADALATNYVKLLQAAFDPKSEMEISVGFLEGFQFRLYFQVYYRLIAWYARKHFIREDLRAFFPAISIRNQMVLVPHGLGSQLRYLSDSDYPLRSLDAGGTQEADFKDTADLESAFKKVYETFRSSFLQELCAYASYQRETQLTVAAVTRDLKMDSGFVQRVLRGQSVAFESSCYPALTCTLSSQQVPVGRWTKLTLSIQNSSREDIRAISVFVEGPVKIRPERLYTGVAAGQTATIEFALLPENAGQFPIEVKFALAEDKPLLPWLPSQYIWLDVGTD